MTNPPEHYLTLDELRQMGQNSALAALNVELVSKTPSFVNKKSRDHLNFYPLLPPLVIGSKG